MSRSIFLLLLLTINYIRCDYRVNTTEKNEEAIHQEQDIVRIDFYYESLCPRSISTYRTEFLPVVQNLNNYIDVHTYPFGGSKILNKNGRHLIKCHHGHQECIGNARHACAIDVLKNTTDYVKFNACLMKERNRSVEQCGRLLEIDVEAIANCFKSERAMDLLKHYEEETKKQHLRYVPYLLINSGNLKNTDGLMNAVCDAFKKRPNECDN
ncbi:GILT-like protein 2 [Hyposmocoma kahamanoa]|uniref:GILT-like protein 2 n=1 Tax=Hyposmocoma kahamanoa TaxID=1477025 RepID=UPI000E6D62C1|nr:GILT-like protein 2 [Hyposmocoma kahamanoa]